MTDPAVALQMYTALTSLPCGCCRKWNKEDKVNDGFTITKVCSRCRAMRAYEAATTSAVPVI